ncbi:MAG: tRNA epoxyqueuosine(34) reductase QueG [bacterium]
MDLTSAVKAEASRLGFDLVGVAPATPTAEHGRLAEWLKKGLHGRMAYMARQPARRMDVRRVLDECRSVVVVGLLYNTDEPFSTNLDDPARGWVSRYGWGDDYHGLMEKKLGELAAFIESVAPGVATRSYVDTGPVMEKALAQAAGLGWIGKNTCLLNDELGSFLFLGVVLTTAQIEPDAPAVDQCGSCTACLQACPTDALVEPYVLDARRCISYLTIELKEAIPTELRADMGRHLFGCDICQDVCPYNPGPSLTRQEGFAARPALLHPLLAELASWDEEAFRSATRRSPLRRPKFRGFRRNLAVALANADTPEAEEMLAEMAEDPDPLVAEHARWGLERRQR